MNIAYTYPTMRGKDRKSNISAAKTWSWSKASETEEKMGRLYWNGYCGNVIWICGLQSCDLEVGLLVEYTSHGTDPWVTVIKVNFLIIFPNIRFSIVFAIYAIILRPRKVVSWIHLIHISLKLLRFICASPPLFPSSSSHFLYEWW